MDLCTACDLLPPAPAPGTRRWRQCAPSDTFAPWRGEVREWMLSEGRRVLLDASLGGCLDCPPGGYAGHDARTPAELLEADPSDPPEVAEWRAAGLDALGTLSETRSGGDQGEDWPTEEERADGHSVRRWGLCPEGQALLAEERVRAWSGMGQSLVRLGWGEESGEDGPVCPPVRR